MTIGAAQLLALLLATGVFAPPQAGAIVDYAWGESRLQPCAHSWSGKGLIGVAGTMRRRLRAAEGPGCVSAERQIDFLAREWPRLYPACAARFAAGDLRAFKRCWGRGGQR
jgi:hypothetical protein